MIVAELCTGIQSSFFRATIGLKQMISTIHAILLRVQLMGVFVEVGSAVAPCVQSKRRISVCIDLIHVFFLQPAAKLNVDATFWSRWITVLVSVANKITPRGVHVDYLLINIPQVS